MTAQWKRQAERAEERQALDELAHADPRGRVRLICGGSCSCRKFEAVRA